MDGVLRAYQVTFHHCVGLNLRVFNSGFLYASQQLEGFADDGWLALSNAAGTIYPLSSRGIAKGLRPEILHRHAAMGAATPVSGVAVGHVQLLTREELHA